MEDMTDWKGKRVLVIGAARQGKALSSYLARHGASVILNDLSQSEDMIGTQKTLLDEVKGTPGNIECVFGGHPEWLLNDVDLVCPSGGIPLTLPLLIKARERGIPFSNDSQIFLEEAPCPVIGITGSAGKTTTTTIVGRMAESNLRQRNTGGRVYVGGNIGAPLINWLDEMGEKDLAVVELSSFQLELMTISPHVAAVLNITPNHLDRHASMEDYTAAKARILEFQKLNNAAVINREDPVTWSLADKVKGRLITFGLHKPPVEISGLFIRDSWITFQENGPEKELLPLSIIEIRGEHNLLNVLAACAVGKAAGFHIDDLRTGIEGFRGVAHRMEFVRHWRGVDWYNDSIATAPERSMAAVRSFDEPLILLAGGRDKKLPWEDFACLVNQKVEHLVLFGEAREKIAAAVEANQHIQPNQLASIRKCVNLQEAVRVVSDLARPGHVILLSPGGTSFDEFRDFEERGEAFKKWVMELT
jgi:UDP-N-acetylmuramoylalanine--D-glutamate ligase